MYVRTRAKRGCALHAPSLTCMAPTAAAMSADDEMALDSAAEAACMPPLPVLLLLLLLLPSLGAAC
jgi:hypothetical protein